MNAKENNKRLRRDLLNKDIPPSFIEENTERYSRSADKDISPRQSYVVFRLGEKWLALGTKYFFQTFEKRYIHIVPHRTGGILSGLVNVNGNLELAIDLRKIFETETSEDIVAGMMEAGNGQFKVVFSVDEIGGTVSVPADKIEKLPSEIITSSMFKARFLEKGRQVYVIDDAVFFEQIEKKLNG